MRIRRVGQLLALAAVLAFAAVGCSAQPADEQRVAVAAIERLGGAATVRDGAVVQVSFSGVEISDAALAQLGGLRNLESLYLTGTSVGDAGLEHLAGLSSLVNLYLSGTKVTDAGLEQLGAHTKLRVLALDSTVVSDAGVERLAALTGLVHLNLSKTGVTEAGVERLKLALPGCTILYSEAEKGAAGPR